MRTANLFLFLTLESVCFSTVDIEKGEEEREREREKQAVLHECCCNSFAIFFGQAGKVQMHNLFSVCKSNVF